MNNEIANEIEQKAEPTESQKSESGLNLLDLSSNNNCEQKACSNSQPNESKAALNLVDLKIDNDSKIANIRENDNENDNENDLDESRRHRHYPNPFPLPRPRPTSHVGGTRIEVHNGKIVVHRN